MQQIATVWNALDMRRRVIVAVATVAMFAAVLALARIAATPGMALLYAGLESGPAGEVVGALEQRGVVYEVRGGAIFVDAGRRDELRMTLASEGLPRNSARGYELLDGLSGFGTTAQMFNAAYWRAKEGELARTIVSHPAITSARVHIAQTGTNPFQRGLRPKASVSVAGAAGRITAAHARALKYLIASAVAGLSPDDVAVIDGDGDLLGETDETPAQATDGLAETLRQRVERMLAARVGAGNAVVEVSVDTVTRSETLRERVIDPESRVAISTDSEEREKAASGDGGGGEVTVASNLPTGDAAGGSTSQATETRERVNYEVSETERQVVQGPGDIRRLTVAVLLNDTVSAGGDGTLAFAPRPDEELAALEELVASAVGFDAARGDVITIKSMPFEQVAQTGTEAADGILTRIAGDAMSLVRMAVLAVVALVLALFVIRPLLMRPASMPPRRLSAPAPTEAVQAADRPAASGALTGEIDSDEGEPPEMKLALAPGGETGMPALAGAVATGLADIGRTGPDPAERLRGLIDARRDETVEILRSWLEGEEEKA